MATFFPDTSVLMSGVFYDEGDLFTKASKDFLSDRGLIEEDRIKILDSVDDEFNKLIERWRRRLNEIVQSSIDLIKKASHCSLARELANLLKSHLRQAGRGDWRFVWMVGYQIFRVLEQYPEPGEFGRKLFDWADMTESEVLFRSEEFKRNVVPVRVKPSKDANKVVEGIENKPHKRDKEHLARVVQFVRDGQYQAVFLTNDAGLLAAYEKRVTRKPFEIAVPYMYMAFKE